MTKNDLKEKAIDAIPYVAVFGVAALAVYGVTKLAQAAKEIDIFPLDFGNDDYLTGLSEDSNED
jgi:hypothetical protein